MRREERRIGEGILICDGTEFMQKRKACIKKVGMELICGKNDVTR